MDFLPPVLLPTCSPHGPRTPDGMPWPLDERWRTETVVGLARGIREREAFERLPILADALQEAGCEDETVLRHCREPGNHHRLCWVVSFCVEGEFRPKPVGVPLLFRPAGDRPVRRPEEQSVGRPWWVSLLLAPIIATVVLVIAWLVIVGFLCRQAVVALRHRQRPPRG